MYGVRNSKEQQVIQAYTPWKLQEKAGGSHIYTVTPLCKVFFTRKEMDKGSVKNLTKKPKFYEIELETNKCIEDTIKKMKE